MAQVSEVSAQSGCVTKKEYRSLRMGMSKSSVHRIIGTSGQLIAWTKSGGYKIEGRTYSTCSPYDVGVVSLNFENGKLTIKTSAFVK